MKKLIALLPLLLIASLVHAKGKIQNEDVKTLTELQSAGGAASQLINDTKIYVTANSLNKQLSQAIIDNDFSAATLADPSINYVTNGKFEASATGWAAYADAAGAIPVDGTGGSPTVTFARNTSSPLRGLGDGLLTKDAANRQGEGFSYAFTIDNADISKPIAISFDYLAAGSFAAGASSDVRMFVYDVTNNVVIDPDQSVLYSASGRYQASFLATTATSYRLIFHIATTNALAYTLRVDNVRVGPSTAYPLIRSEIFITGQNGYGSTNTKIPRFLTVQKNVGPDVSYVDSATNGASFTINTSGLYAVTYVSSFATVPTTAGLSLNSSQLTTNIISINNADRIAIEWFSNADGNVGKTQSVILKLNPGDVVRAHTNGDALSTLFDVNSFRIVKVGN